MTRPATRTHPLHRLDRAVAHAATALALLLGSVVAQAQAQLLAMPDSINNRLVGFSPADGSLRNAELFPLAGGTPVHALCVGNKIWVTGQICDRVSRWGADGSFLGQIGGAAAGGGQDNMRGMGLVGGTVYRNNAGTANGAPGAAAVMFSISGAAAVMFSTSGAAIGSFATAVTAPSPFGVLAYQGGLLVSSSSANNDIHRHSLAGAALGTFHNSASLNFAQQMVYAGNGDILGAGFSSNDIVRLSAATDAVLTVYAGAGARGVAPLGNGNVMWTSGAGAFVLNTGTGTNTRVYSGGGRYLELISVVPEPATVLLRAGGPLAVVGVARLRRVN